MNNLQTELKIFVEDASTGQYSSAYRLAVVPDMTVAEVCDIIAQKHCKANPERYGLFTVVDGQGEDTHTHSLSHTHTHTHTLSTHSHSVGDG